MDQTKLKRLRQTKKKADDAYFNSDSPIMSDKDYDLLCQQIAEIDVSISEVGCLPRTDKIQLPIYMGSLTKYNDNKSINNFLTKFDHKQFVVQEKLDGVSCLCVYRCRNIELYTRGNGTIGVDISHLLEYGLDIPKIESYHTFMVRGELIMSKKIFKEKFSIEFKNIRNMVSGQLAKKKPNESIIKFLDFVAYEVFEPHLKIQKSVVNQYQFLKQNKFKVVYNRTIERDLVEQDVLVDYVHRRKKKSQYDIDGLVITINGEYIRNDCDNPKYSFAFKIQGEVAQVEVDHVKWNLSKSGRYKPQIFINPVELSGVTISSVTGFNAKYITENKIGCGSILIITRSGDVIPHIVAVVKGKGDLNLPTQSRWKSVDLYHDYEKIPDQVIVKQMVYFFASLKCLNCKDKTIFKIFNSGYSSIESVIQARPEELSQIDGIGEKLAIKLSTSIKENVKVASIHQLLAALNCFGEGIGLRKIQNIDLSNPENLQVKGLSEVTIKDKILPAWKDSLNRVMNIKKMVGGSIELEKQNIEIGDGPLQNKIFVFTGFRDSSLEKQIIELGGKVTSAISNKTTDLVVASEEGKSSTKLLKAKNLGIKITTKSNLIGVVKNIQKQQIKIEVEYSDVDSSSEEE
jgi:NAD-dependent DNA ligase